MNKEELCEWMKTLGEDDLLRLARLLALRKWQVEHPDIVAGLAWFKLQDEASRCPTCHRRHRGHGRASRPG